MLGAQLNRAWGGEFFAGVMEAAEAADVNVVCFVGGRPSSMTGSISRETSFGFYDLVKPGHYDGILLAADIGHGLTPDELKAFRRLFADLPLVTFALPMDGSTDFMADNEQGMRSIIRHLIEGHGFERIAFIRGIKGQIESEMRFKAYQDELKKHRIRFEERLVVDGDFSTESGRSAVRTLLEERGIKFQAIAASNDRMAFGAMEALQQRGIQVPDAVALTGFDDVAEAESLGVPLTTVHQSFYDSGRRTFEGLMKRIEGVSLDPRILTPAKLVVRWSCGCLPESVKQAIVLPKEVAHTGRLENKRDAAVRALLAAGGIPENSPYRDRYREVFLKIWDVFLASLGEADRSDAFLRMTQTVVEMLQLYQQDVTTWHNIFSTFRKFALGGITDHVVMLRAENLFQQARMLVGELSQRAQAFRRLQFVQQEEALGNFGFSIAPAMSLPEIGDAISRHFPLLGITRCYVMFYSETGSAGSISSRMHENYRLLMQYEGSVFQIPQEQSVIATGRLVPQGKHFPDRRYSSVIMPLTLANNRFGFMWTEVGPRDWDIYVRVRNLLSSALLRTMLVQQRERAQKEIERLLNEARDRAGELAKAKDVAEKAAVQNAELFKSEQARRRGAEALARSSRMLSSLSTVEKLPGPILEGLHEVLLCQRSILLMREANGLAVIRSHRGFPVQAPMQDFKLKMGGEDFYETVVQKEETLLVQDIHSIPGWDQPNWLPRDRSWMGVPLFSKNQVIGLLVLAREKEPFNQDDVLLASTFAMQAAVALENARLYDELTGINQMMEGLVAQRVEELKKAYQTLDQHDKNKSAFIQVAAHELRTPLTVIKGYLGMLKGSEVIRSHPELDQTIEGVLQGTNRLHQIVNSMLDVARLDNQVLSPNLAPVQLGMILHSVQKEFAKDLEDRKLNFTLDESILEIPSVAGDHELLRKAFDHIIVNAIKFTPDGGTVSVTARVERDSQIGDCAEVRVQDTGIGIDAEHHEIIFEKLFQLGKVELHSSSRTNYKGGGAGLGLAIAAGIVKALNGKIWVESQGHDEVNFPGSTFFIRLPLAK